MQERQNLALGNVIGFLDADDLWPPNKLELQLAHLANDPSVEIVLGRKQFIRLTGEMKGKPTFEARMDPRLALSLGCALIRESAFDKVGFPRRRTLEGTLAEQVVHECAYVEANLRPERLVVRLKDHPLGTAIKALFAEQGDPAHR